MVEEEDSLTVCSIILCKFLGNRSRYFRDDAFENNIVFLLLGFVSSSAGDALFVETHPLCFQHQVHVRK